MKKLSTNVLNAISASDIKLFLLINFPGMNKNWTTCPYNLTMSDGITYDSQNFIDGLDPPRVSNVVDREIYRISLFDPDYSVRTYFENNPTGDTMTLRMGFFDNANQPYTNINDTMVIYRGYVDSAAIEFNFKENENKCIIELASPVAMLDKRNTFYTSRAFLRNKYPNDTSFDEVHVSSGKALLKWGKA